LTSSINIDIFSSAHDNVFYRKHGERKEFMREEIISSYLEELSASLGGVRPSVGRQDLLILYGREDFAGMVRHVRTTLGLDVRIRLGLVNSGGPVHAPAWMSPLGGLPPCGTAAFSQMTLTLFIRKSFLAAEPFDGIVIALAHELCHIILSGIGHRLAGREEAVDLAAMILGYRGFYRRGCEGTEVVVSARPIGPLRWESGLCFGSYRVERRITIYQLGYLSRDEVRFAADAMDFRCGEATGESR
jgi:hypothetical protein